MKYMGSKRRIAKYIAPIIQGFIDSSGAKTYIEPFVGGANMIEHIKCENLRGSDTDRHLIALYHRLQGGWLPPKNITEKAYHYMKANPSEFTDAMLGYVGFQLSYGALWFGSYRRDKAGKRNYSLEAYRHVAKQAPMLQDVQFTCEGYQNWCPENAVVYCDPPYANTTKYKGDFDHEAFWRWCRVIAEPQRGNTVLVSEYNAPDGIECIWSKEITSSLTKDTGAKKGVEKLFWVKP